MAASLTSTDLTLGNTSGASIPGTPSAGQTVLYPKDDKLLYYKDDAGVESEIVRLAQFTKSLTAAGYQVLPSGLIIQWCTSAVTSITGGTNTNITTTLPMAFPTAGLFSVCNIQAIGNDTANVRSTNVNAITTTTVTAQVHTTTTQNLTLRYIAIGY